MAIVIHYDGHAKTFHIFQTTIINLCSGASRGLHAVAGIDLWISGSISKNFSIGCPPVSRDWLAVRGHYPRPLTNSSARFCLLWTLGCFQKLTLYLAISSCCRVYFLTSVSSLYIRERWSIPKKLFLVPQLVREKDSWKEKHIYSLQCRLHNHKCNKFTMPYKHLSQREAAKPSTCDKSYSLV